MGREIAFLHEYANKVSYIYIFTMGIKRKYVVLSDREWFLDKSVEPTISTIIK